MGRMVFVVLVITSLALAEVAYHGVRFLIERRREEFRRRLRLVGHPDSGIQLLRDRQRGSTAAEQQGVQAGAARHITKLLEQTDLDWGPARLVVYSLLYALAGGALGFMALHSAIVGTALGAGGATLPWLFLMRERRRRSEALSRQLPEALDMIARSLRAGHSLPASFRLVAQEMQAPVAVEFGRAFEQQNLGMPFEEAVVAMVDRVPMNTDLAIFGVSVLVQHETGGNLVENLEHIAETVRERERFHGRLRVLTAEGRLSAIILSVLPLVVAAIFATINRSYMLELAVGVGQTIVAGGVVLWMIGILWLRSLSRVEY